MLLLFASFFFASVIFLVFFLMYLPDDLKKRSLRPLFAILPAIGFWIFTLPALLTPEQGITITAGSSVTTVASVALPLAGYNAFLVPWLAIFMLLMFLAVLWYYLLLQRKAQELMKEGAGAIHGFEQHFGK